MIYFLKLLWYSYLFLDFTLFENKNTMLWRYIEIFSLKPSLRYLQLFDSFLYISLYRYQSLQFTPCTWSLTSNGSLDEEDVCRGKHRVYNDDGLLVLVVVATFKQFLHFPEWYWLILPTRFQESPESCRDAPLVFLRHLVSIGRGSLRVPAPPVDTATYTFGIFKIQIYCLEA